MLRYVNVMEFMLSPEHRRPYGMRAIGCLVVAVLFGFAAVAALAIAVVPAVLFLLAAVVAGVRWYGRLTFATRVSADGIEVRGYRAKHVPWADVKGIEVHDYVRAARVGVRNGPAGRSRSGSGGHKKEAVVKVSLHSGRVLELRAPMVTRELGDSEFDNKVSALRSAWTAWTAQDQVRTQVRTQVRAQAKAQPEAQPQPQP
jgi:hypothetical protein